MYVFACVQDAAVALSVICPVVFSLRTKSTPTPTASFSVNGMPMEAVDYERLKQVDPASLSHLCKSDMSKVKSCCHQDGGAGLAPHRCTHNL